MKFFACAFLLLAATALTQAAVARSPEGRSLSQFLALKGGSNCPPAGEPDTITEITYTPSTTSGELHTTYLTEPSGSSDLDTPPEVDGARGFNHNDDDQQDLEDDDDDNEQFDMEQNDEDSDVAMDMSARRDNSANGRPSAMDSTRQSNLDYQLRRQEDLNKQLRQRISQLQRQNRRRAQRARANQRRMNQNRRRNAARRNRRNRNRT